jgi:surface antigen
LTLLLLCLLIFVFAGLWTEKNFSLNSSFSIGQPIDSLNGVKVYYNGEVGNVSGRNLSADNYNLGVKYQCVEFIKRYYFEHLKHKMPDSHGNAKDYFDRSLPDGSLNKKRDLKQFENPSKTKPKIDDIIVFSETNFNKFGHVAIVSNVMDNEVEIIQQNPGKYGKSRKTISLDKENGKWKLDNKRILGWLRKEE